MVAGWIRPSNHDLGVAYGARGDKREQGGSIAERKPHAPMRRRRAEAGMVRAVTAWPRELKKIECGIPALSHSREYAFAPYETECRNRLASNIWWHRSETRQR